MLSIIANSASVEVWIIDQDVLGLLPFDVQAKLVNRLKAEQKVRINEDDILKRPKDHEFKRVKEE